MTGVLEVPAGIVRNALASIADGRTPGTRRMRDVIVDPRTGTLRLQAGERAVHARLGDDWSVLVTPPDADGRSRIVPLATSFVPKAVLRAAGVLGAPDRTALTWTLAAAGAHGGGREVVVHDDGRRLHLRRDDAWRPLTPTELYVLVVELVLLARPDHRGGGSWASTSTSPPSARRPSA